MNSMLRPFAVAAVLFAATQTARAQAPGEMSGDPGYATAPGYAAAAPGETPVMAPPTPAVFVNPGDAPINVMADRFAVGLSVGALSLAPKDSPDQKTQFNVGELSLRFRLTPHLELEGEIGGGREQKQDGSQGNLEARTGLLAARIRLAPAQHWNWWLMGGIGSLQTAQHGATDQQFKDSERPLGALGIGLERRFVNFAIHAELRAVGVGQSQQQNPPQPAQPVMTTVPTKGTMPPPPPPPQTTQAPDPHVSGGMLTIGASYYF
jgi:hypothetical protein